MRRFLRLRTASYGFLLLVLMAFPYGPLFPWSPVTPGYERLQLSRADVYYPSGTALPDAYRQMDRLIRECEEFHRLPMTRRMTVVACRDWSDSSGSCRI